MRKSILVLVLILGFLASCGGTIPTRESCSPILLEQAKRNTNAMIEASKGQQDTIRQFSEDQAKSMDGLTLSVRDLIKELRESRSAPLIIERETVFPGKEK